MMVMAVNIIPSLDLEYWLESFGLQVAYFHISIIPPHRNYLRLVIDQNYSRSYQLACQQLCFAIVVAHLRRNKVFLCPFLYNWLEKGWSSLRVL